MMVATMAISKPPPSYDDSWLAKSLAAYARAGRAARATNAQEATAARWRSFVWQQQLYGQTATPAAKGITMGVNTITIHGKTYTRAEFRTELEQSIKAQRADPKSPYNDQRHPSHAEAVSEMQLGYKFLGNELSAQTESEIARGWHEAATEE